MSEQASTYFIEKVWERYPKITKKTKKEFYEVYKKIGHNVRGIYALLRKQKRKNKTYYNVVYIGMSNKGIMGGRIYGHIKSKSKNFTHFSVYKVFYHITKPQIEELEGLFRIIFRKDKRALKFNKQKKHKKFNIEKWEQNKRGKNGN